MTDFNSPEDVIEAIRKRNAAQQMHAQADALSVESFVDGLSADDLFTLRAMLADIAESGPTALGTFMGRVETRYFDKVPEACRGCGRVHDEKDSEDPIVFFGGN